ncbi:serine/threonine protein kinase [Klebsiella sp. MBT K-1]|nr:serine/threonine protein kinase [Klebsiella sp. MBT K-1]
MFLFLCFLRSCMSWHYPNSPKKPGMACRAHQNWLPKGSSAENDPLPVWFYPR